MSVTQLSTGHIKTIWQSVEQRWEKVKVKTALRQWPWADLAYGVMIRCRPSAPLSVMLVEPLSEDRSDGRGRHCPLPGEEECQDHEIQSQEGSGRCATIGGHQLFHNFSPQRHRGLLGHAELLNRAHKNVFVAVQEELLEGQAPSVPLWCNKHSPRKLLSPPPRRYH